MFSVLVGELFQDKDFLKLNSVNSDELFGYLDTVTGLVNRFQEEVGITPSDVCEFSLVEDIIRDKTSLGQFPSHRGGLESHLSKGGFSLWKADNGEGKSKSYACLNQLEQIDSGQIGSFLDLSSWGARMVHENVHNTQYRSKVGDSRLIEEYVRFIEGGENSGTSKVLGAIIEQMAIDMQTIYGNFEYSSFSDEERNFSRRILISPKLYLDTNQEIIDFPPIKRELDKSTKDLPPPNKLLEIGRRYLDDNLTSLIQFFELDEVERTEENFRTIFDLTN